MEEFTTTQIGARLGVSERTVQRWIRSGKIKATLQANGYYLLDPADLDTLRIPTLPTTSASDFADILSRLETVEQRIGHLEDMLGTFQSQTPRTSGTMPQAPSASSPSQREVSETVGELPDGLVGWRQFARLHEISESTIHKAIKSGRLPAIHGPWRVGKVLYGEALDENGRRRFHELYHLLLPCALCGMK